MNDSTASEQQERAPDDRLEQLAAGIFARRGVDFATARRAGGWSNATWLAGGLALRLAARPGSDKIRREARLAALLPPEVGYPLTVETGVTEGHEWCLSREIPGQCLGEVWDNLPASERASALRQAWAIMQAVHTVDPAAAAGLARTRAWFNSDDPAEAAAGLNRLEQQGILSARQAGRLRGALERFWQALPGAPRVLNHGDLTLDNMLWHEGRVVSLLDFEFAVIAPAELDVNTFLTHAFEPGGGDDLLGQVAADLARPALASPGSRERLFGYAVLLALWRMADWLAHPEGEDPDVTTWEPYRRLASLDGGPESRLVALVQGR